MIQKDNFIHNHDRTPIETEKTHKVAKEEFDKLSLEEVTDKIKEMMEKIDENYSYEKCIDIVGNSGNISDSLYGLLRGTSNHRLSVENMHKNYLMCLCAMSKNKDNAKDYAYNFLCGIENLYSELAREFSGLADEFFYGSYQNGGNGYERS